MDGWIHYEGKQVFIKLKNNREYSGYVLEISKDWLVIKDKYGKNVTVRKDDISVIEEERR